MSGLLAKLLFAKMLADAMDDDDTPPDNYSTLPTHPQAWQKRRDDYKKQNQVICIEFLDIEMSKHRTATERLAQEFHQVPFLRVVVDQTDKNEPEVCKDVGGIQQLPAIVVLFYGKRGDQDQKFAVKYQGLQEIQEGLKTDTLRKNIGELIARRDELKQAEQLQHAETPGKKQQEEVKETTYKSSLKDHLSHVSKQRAAAVNDNDKDEEIEFSKSMNPGSLSKWLLKDAGRHYKEDIDKLERGKVGGREFLHLPTDTEVLQELNVSLGFRAYMKARVNQLKGVNETDTCSTSESTKMEFSESFTPKELASWLTKELGDDYKDDITKLKDCRINGRLFLQQENLATDLGLSYGFQLLFRDLLLKLKEVNIHQASSSTKSASQSMRKVKLTESSSPDELALWLYQNVGSSYKDDIAKLKENRINGRLFLQKKNLMSELGLSLGFVHHIFDLLPKLKDKQAHQSLVGTAQPIRFKITDQPRDQKKHIHQGTVLTVRVDRDHPTLKYQWTKDSKILLEDQLIDCTGVTSNTLRFNSLNTKHIGSYVCQVTCGSRMIMSKAAKVEVLTSMKLSDFFRENSECQDGLVIITDALKKGFQSHLQRFGYTCVEDVDKTLENIEANASVSYVDAIIDFQTQEVNTKLDRIGHPKECINSKVEDRVEQYQKSVKYVVGSENSVTKVRGWSVGGGLDGSYQGTGANVGIEYGRQKITAKTRMECTEREETFNDCILVPGESRVKVTIEKRLDTCVCEVKDLLVTFHPKFSSIRCRYEGKSTKGKTSRGEFKFEDIFYALRDQTNKHALTIKLNGKCQWSETTVYLHRSEPEPLTLFRDLC